MSGGGRRGVLLTEVLTRALIYLILTIVAIRHAWKKERAERDARIADVRLQELRRDEAQTDGAAASSSPPAGATVIAYGDRNMNARFEEDITAQPWAETRPTRSSTGSWSQLEDPFEDPVNPYEEPVRATDMV